MVENKYFAIIQDKVGHKFSRFDRLTVVVLSKEELNSLRYAYQTNFSNVSKMNMRF